jgi:hypothetical protein
MVGGLTGVALGTEAGLALSQAQRIEFAFAMGAAGSYAQQTIATGEADPMQAIQTGLVMGGLTGAGDWLSDTIRSRIAQSQRAQISEQTQSWLDTGPNNNTVYRGVNAQGQEVYTGITRQDLASRLYQHNYAGKDFVSLNPMDDVLTTNLTRNQARAIEQYFITNGPANELNRINSISPNSQYYEEALLWAEQYLASIL